ncbi:hypothetical protein ACZ90_52760 [Streptomyces albus subsp. albus]|nr:hypothetical protein ACZ90_52760 [Streptomyces albus subsp. albus]
MAASASYGLRFDTGRVCLDLLATAGGRPGQAPVDRLDGPDRLRDWLRGAALVPEGTPLDRVDGGWLSRFLTARDLLRRVVRAEWGGQATGADLDRLNALAGSAPPAVRAVRTADGTLARILGGPPDCGALLALVARDAVDLLTDPVARGQLRECAGERCSLLYLDTSHGRRRRWCSSEVCGNRARVARHRRRTGVRDAAPRA